MAKLVFRCLSVGCRIAIGIFSLLKPETSHEDQLPNTKPDKSHEDQAPNIKPDISHEVQVLDTKPDSHEDQVPNTKPDISYKVQILNTEPDISHEDQVPNTKPRHSLSSMPVEILLYMKDFLPMSAAGCLALCNHNFFTIIGNPTPRSVRLLRTQDHLVEKRRFLASLQKDLPDWLLCYPCAVLHPVKTDESPHDMWRYYKEPLCVQENGVVYLTLEFRIRFHQAQLVMNHYRLKRPYMEYLERLSRDYSSVGSEASLQSTIRAAIIADELVVSLSQTLRLQAPPTIGTIHWRLTPVCPHLQHSADDRTLWKAIECQLSHTNTLPCGDCKVQKRCRECSTWFQVEVEKLGNSETELQLEVWKHLGTCESPYDPKWRKQTKGPYSPPWSKNLNFPRDAPRGRRNESLERAHQIYVGMAYNRMGRDALTRAIQSLYRGASSSPQGVTPMAN